MLKEFMYIVHTYNVACLVHIVTVRSWHYDLLAAELVKSDVPVADYTDCNVIYYVCGALIRSELQMRRGCEKCTSLLVQSRPFPSS